MSAHVPPTLVTFDYETRVPPPGVPYIDCRQLPEPAHAATDAAVGEFLCKHDPQLYARLVNESVRLLRSGEAQVWLGCTPERQRSSAVARAVARDIRLADSPVCIMNK